MRVPACPGADAVVQVENHVGAAIDGENLRRAQDERANRQEGVADDLLIGVRPIRFGRVEGRDAGVNGRPDDGDALLPGDRARRAELAGRLADVVSAAGFQVAMIVPFAVRSAASRIRTPL